ncbi:hypothetical protein TELCIR_12373 [Teladorsagia circumcincta]|uniref:Uncharacterized protein n=1 Tax=Teladorsagia circumcincta TaxID=45464 RepID=A0A2G9U8X0_TELCI|nr:hypothetical protein TELCIR_12373 [Teladorsagia circumcincta]
MVLSRFEHLTIVDICSVRGWEDQANHLKSFEDPPFNYFAAILTLDYHSLRFVYVIVSILMVVLWSAYLCFDGRREPKKDTRVIHKLAQSTLLRAVP